MIDSHYYEHDGRRYLSVDGLRYLAENNLVIDGTTGGLVIGPLLAEGGITLVNFTLKGEYFVNEPVSGWSYLLNNCARFFEADKLTSLKCTLLQRMSWYCPYNVPESVQVYDASPRLVDGELVTPFIFTGAPETAFIDPVTTKFHLERIDQINKQAFADHHKGYRKEEDINAVGMVAHTTPRFDN